MQKGPAQMVEHLPGKAQDPEFNLCPKIKMEKSGN
jgi:hypothetical protein